MFASEEEAARAYDAAAGPLGRPVNFPAEGQAQAVKQGSSRLAGVDWNADRLQWEASGLAFGKWVHLGFFDTEEQAARRHDDHAVLRGGSRVNFTVEGEERVTAKEPTSRFVGVRRDPKHRTWDASIGVGGAARGLGSFASEEAAARAYDAAAGPLGRPVNFPTEEQAQAVKRGSSKYRGVTWQRVTRKWKAKIYVGGKAKHLGLFESEEEAAWVYDEVARPLGKPVNFPNQAQELQNALSFFGVGVRG